jgi:hypothetical protein
VTANHPITTTTPRERLLNSDESRRCVAAAQYLDGFRFFGWSNSRASLAGVSLRFGTPKRTISKCRTKLRQDANGFVLFRIDALEDVSARVGMDYL